MKTERVFKLEKNPSGYGQDIVPNCKVSIRATRGAITLDYQDRYLVGRYDNLRFDGENVLADITIQEDMKDVEHRFEYAIAAGTKKNDSGQTTEIVVTGITALMPPRD